jgi:hypothetical protein
MNRPPPSSLAGDDLQCEQDDLRYEQRRADEHADQDRRQLPTLFEHARVSDVMRPVMLTCDSDTPLEDLARMMVTERSRHLAGVITAVITNASPNASISSALSDRSPAY